jgi:hypothetical protein
MRVTVNLEQEVQEFCEGPLERGTWNVAPDESTL